MIISWKQCLISFSNISRPYFCSIISLSFQTWLNTSQCHNFTCSIFCWHETFNSLILEEFTFEIKSVTKLSSVYVIKLRFVHFKNTTVENRFLWILTIINRFNIRFIIISISKYSISISNIFAKNKVSTLSKSPVNFFFFLLYSDVSLNQKLFLFF